MVFLDVYDKIWNFLEEEGILNDIISEFEEYIGKKNLAQFRKHEGSEKYADVILEYGLFNYTHKKKLLIDYVSECHRNSLDESEKRQLFALSESQRETFTFLKKITRNEKDTNGKMLSDFYFKDTSTGKINIVTSSAELDKLTPELNMRLIRSPFHEIDRYNIIGLIHSPEQAECLASAAKMKTIIKNIDHSRERKDILFRLSTQLSFEEIDSFEDKSSRFKEQDRIIMRLNKQFHERFKMNLDDFMNNAYELSNEKSKFREMYRYYESISGQLHQTVYNTSYIMGMKFFSYNATFKAFFGFIMEDPELLEKGIIALKEEAKEEFELEQQRLLSLTRERIINHQRNQIKKIIDDLGASKEKSAKHKKERYKSILRKINKLKADDIDMFLNEFIEFLSREKMLLVGIEDGDHIDMRLDFMMMLKSKSDEIPYLEDAEKELKKARFEDDGFYNYYSGLSDEMYDLIKILYAAHLFSEKEYRRAYDLIKGLNIETNQSFSEMFFVGKVFSLFENKAYKTYFHHAKKIDKQRYKTNLEKFLAWKGSIPEDELKQTTAK
ncbi:MAG: hypothetical protein ABIG84_06785 [archaeon]